MRWSAASIVLLVLLGGCAAPRGPDAPDATATTSTGTTQPMPCGHRHVTFSIVLPGGREVDYATPRAPEGRFYYDLGSVGRGGARRFTVAAHMHQDAANPESGPAALAAHQMHVEGTSACLPAAGLLAAMDAKVTSSAIALDGGHAQVAGQSGTFPATSTQPLRVWVERDLRHCVGQFDWQETTWSEVQDASFNDGEALLVALGSYSDAEVRQMQDRVPAPSSRPPPSPCPSLGPQP